VGHGVPHHSILQKRIIDPQAAPVVAQLSGPAIPGEALSVAEIILWCNRTKAFPGFPQWSPEARADRRLRGLEFTQLSPAAVLIAVCPVSSDLILTRRPLHLKDHPGQISFPGGRMEPSDASLIETACREAEEEIGLKRHWITPLLTLPQYITVTGFQVTPVLGVLSPGYGLSPHPDEVDEIVRVPLGFLMDPRNHQLRQVTIESELIEFFAMPYQSHFIWGATAAMIRNLYHFFVAAWNQSLSPPSDHS
jgi:8-oxo-dGTP pyrophosphatase MutT (NUDIX family)